MEGDHMNPKDTHQDSLDLPALWSDLQDLEDGSLAEDKREALLALLHRSPAARRAYIEYFHQVAILGMEAAKVREWGDLPVTCPIVPFKPWWQRSPLAVAAVLLLSALIGALVLRPGSRPTSGPEHSMHALNARATEGSLWEINGVRQADSTKHVEVKTDDSIHVLSGLVQMELPSGSTIVMPSASRASFPTPYQPVLHEGWLWIDTGASNDAFEVSTPELVIQDIGTRFGVRIGESGRSEIHLLEGGVNVISQESGIKLTTLAPDGNGRSIRADGSSSALPLAQDPFPMLQSRLFGETAYANVILSQMPSCYWKFDRGIAGRFDNEVSGGRTAKSGPSVSMDSVAEEDGLHGFGQSNQSLYLPANEMKKSSTSVVAFLDGGKGVSSKQGAVTFWIKQKEGVAGEQILWLAGKPHSEKPGPTQSLAYSYLTESGHVGVTMVSGNQEVSVKASQSIEQGRWHQIGISWSKTELELYVDGKRVAHRNDMSPGEEWATSGNFVRFGKPTDELFHNKFQNFHGWFDEYALWNRPLSPEEVEQQFHTARGRDAD